MKTMRKAENRIKRYGHPLYLVIPYIVFIWVAAMGDFRLWRRTNEAIGTYAKIFSMGIIVIAFVYILLKTDFLKLKKIGKFALFFFLPLLVILMWSVGIWIINFEDMPLMISGCSKLFFQVINILVILSAVYLFEYKAIDYTFYGLACANGLMVVLGIKEFGLSESYGSFINAVSAGTAGTSNVGFMRTIEINDITFAFGLFLLYYLFFDKGGHLRPLKIVLAVFFIFMGYKRIEFAGLLVAIAVFAFFRVFKKARNIQIAMRAMSIFVIVFCCFYLYAVKTGRFAEIMGSAGVDTMGRDMINRYASMLYEISPDFIGYGFEASINLMSELTGGSLLAIHNDIVKAFIEFGFFGFFVWCWFYYYYQPRWYTKHFGERTGVLFMVLLSCMFVTYLTDNTFFYYWDSMILRMIPMAYAFKDSQEYDHFLFLKKRKSVFRGMHLNRESRYRLRSLER